MCLHGMSFMIYLNKWLIHFTCSKSIPLVRGTIPFSVVPGSAIPAFRHSTKRKVREKLYSHTECWNGRARNYHKWMNGRNKLGASLKKYVFKIFQNSAYVIFYQFLLSVKF